MNLEKTFKTRKYFGYFRFAVIDKAILNSYLKLSSRKSRAKLSISKYRATSTTTLKSHQNFRAAVDGEKERDCPVVRASCEDERDKP